MQLDIQSRGFALTDALRSYTLKRLRFALGRNDNIVMRARIRLADINGPRGGVDKRCQIELALAGQANIMIEDTETDLYFAIDRACDRAMRTLSRRLVRSRQHFHEVLVFPQPLTNLQ
ncbi:MAG: HPF/RaiA family ribosome-associated protein [Bdellovibrio sp.]|nr:HPF/RaiA family ribosome-associated protein [Methylotenera sp.]